MGHRGILAHRYICKESNFFIYDVHNYQRQCQSLSPAESTSLTFISSFTTNYIPLASEKALVVDSQVLLSAMGLASN